MCERQWYWRLGGVVRSLRWLHVSLVGSVAQHESLRTRTLNPIHTSFHGAAF
jgi:hypothetical protein